MKSQLLFLIFFLGLISKLCAQDAIYMANGNRFDNAQLIDITEDRVTFTVKQTDKLSTQNYQRDNVLVAFSKGNFLVLKNLNSDLAQAKQELQTFLTTTAWQDQDYLLQAVPFMVIPAKISYENDAIINYVTNDGNSASISKGELIAIFYSDGRHSIVRDITESAPILAELGMPIGASLKVIANQKLIQKPVSTSVTKQQTETTSESITSPSADKQAMIPTSQSSEITTVAPTDKTTLTDSDYRSYRKKALDKVDEFASYLNIITNKSLSLSERNQAVKLASELFMPAATIEVTSRKTPGARKYPISTYLNNLKLLPYSSAKIEWTEVQYIKELTKAADGNYYGIITGQQTFVGYGSNATYSDVTQKNVRVKLERLIDTRDGQDEMKWNLLLGSIGVSAQ